LVETDIASCFESIPHCGLMQAVEERVCDQAVLALIRTLLRAGVMEGGSLRRGVAGTPQGGVISPLLCNAYLHRLDRAWRAKEHGVFTGRDRLLVPVEVIVTELNLFLRGWAGYFRYGNSAHVLGQVGNYALWRLGLWLSKKGNRRHGWRWGVTRVLLSPDHLGLASLHRIVISPRPFRDWRGQAEHRR
jgi:Reverse transcriptase (RNA-dependent DNA polymerase)/Group II intron, maturase-specific domain